MSQLKAGRKLIIHLEIIIWRDFSLFFDVFYDYLICYIPRTDRKTALLSQLTTQKRFRLSSLAGQVPHILRNLSTKHLLAALGNLKIWYFRS